MTTATGRGIAHAKAILIGEHFVLDGVAAIALGLPAFTTETHWVHSARPLALDAQSAAKLPPLAMTDTIAMVSAAAQAAGIAATGEVSIVSSVPMGRGLGSSAALAVAMLRAATSIATADNHRRGAGGPDIGGPIWLLAAARAVESVVHGRSSGLDPAAAMSGGGAIVFAGGEVRETLTPLATSSLRAARWVIADAGPAPATGVAIARANAARLRMGDVATAALGVDVAAAAYAARAGLMAGDPGQIAEAMRVAGRALASLDVTDARIDALVAFFTANGALAAKQSGAGLGGAVLALAPNATIANTLRDRLVERGIESWTLEICS